MGHGNSETPATDLQVFSLCRVRNEQNAGKRMKCSRWHMLDVAIRNDTEPYDFGLGVFG